MGDVGQDDSLGHHAHSLVLHTMKVNVKTEIEGIIFFHEGREICSKMGVSKS